MVVVMMVMFVHVMMFVLLHYHMLRTTRHPRRGDAFSNSPDTGGSAGPGSGSKADGYSSGAVLALYPLRHLLHGQFLVALAMPVSAVVVRGHVVWDMRR